MIFKKNVSIWTSLYVDGSHLVEEMAGVRQAQCDAYDSIIKGMVKDLHSCKLYVFLLKWLNYSFEVDGFKCELYIVNNGTTEKIVSNNIHSKKSEIKNNSSLL